MYSLARVLLGAMFAVLISGAAPATAQSTLLPRLRYVGSEAYTTSAGAFTRWRFDVENKADFPAQIFVAAPNLPPCGRNTSSSRTWVDFFDDTGQRLYGFCALSSPDGLGGLWFATPAGQQPPRMVYIVLTDRQTNTAYHSNIVVMPR